MGTHHRETGLLMMARRGYELHVDEGGVWALDFNRSQKTLLGRRVTVEGTRGGFDLLNVRTIEVATDGSRPPLSHYDVITPNQRDGQRSDTDD